MLGKLLGARYKVIRVLGSGGFGNTYIAEDTQRPGNPWCVLKHLSFASSDSVILAQVRRLFLAEAETLERLGQHPQIPQLLAYFEENQEFYLVQEFIEGHPLSDELGRGIRFSEAQVVELLQDVLGILRYVHGQQVIHRDVKPDNLIRRYRDNRLVLIDFGAVKTISAAVENSANSTVSIPIYTSGYGASEQCMGKPQFNSDIYALGMIGIQALTALRPTQLPQDPDSLEAVWRDLITVSEELGDVLDRMVRYHFKQRYQSAAEVLQALGQFSQRASALTAAPSVMDSLRQIDAAQPTQPNSQSRTEAQRPLLSPAVLSPGNRRWHWWVGLGTIALLTSLLAMAAARFLWPPMWLPKIERSQGEIDRRISQGGTILTPGIAIPAKQSGVKSLAAQDNERAIAALTRARTIDPADPETLIYLNNAQVRNRPSMTIAVAVPLDKAPESAKEILRGVAQAQEVINRAGGINGVGLKVAIASDNNQPAIAQQIAQALVKRPEILGVVGHADSDVSLAAGKVYERGHLVMISPLSSAESLSELGDYIFRTVPSDSYSAQKLADYLHKTLRMKKVAIFSNASNAYSQSLSGEFKRALFSSQAEKPIAEFDLSDPTFNAYESLEKASRYGAEVLMLAPDSTVSDKAMQVVLVNHRRLQVLAGDSLYTRRLLQVWGDAATGMVLAVPTGAGGDIQPIFRQQAIQLWQQPVNWRTALAYDATQALITALQQGNSRQNIQRALSAPDFFALGATGRVSFRATGDREIAIQLVKVTPKGKSAQSGNFEFKPVP
ncbi:MAG: ABC transporter substrate-binding protein [Scytolyngbya sp. HA4215-MV1]|jgi:ABC-type branched-subunit amino acid transport system substrate-binding protein/serine/threonine protein kinase|nr:ABC transporter substrate-binding protein [Scytolyngbya sp. HA4215-MV1]